MRIRRAVAVLAGCAALVLAGSPPATADVERVGCAAETKTTGPLKLFYGDRFTYVYTLTWCVQGGRITGAEQEVGHEEHSPTCTWTGRMEESIIPGEEAWTAFDMSEFACERGDGQTRGVNPWVSVTFLPSGEYTVDNGVAD